MQTITLVESPLWKQFQSAARRRRRDPARLLLDYMRECLEVWEDQKLDEGIRRDAQRSGRRESQSVAIVRKHRRAKGT
jgi:hypothetical protein